MTTVLSFIIVLGVLIVIHELGHFLVARWAGVGVERFSVGFGPVLLRWRGKETEYCLSAIPMGGYVKMMGEESPVEGGGTGQVDPAKSFVHKPLWARFLIVFAGPAMNFVLAAVIFAILLGTVGRPVWPALIGRVTEGTPAAAAGLQTGDQIVGVNGRTVAYWEDVERAIHRSGGQALEFRVLRDGAERTVRVTPQRTTVEDPIFRETREIWDIGAGPRLVPEISAVNPGSPAERAGLQAGDVVVAVAGQPVHTREDLMQMIQRRAGQTFPLTVERDGKPVTVTVTASVETDRTPAGEEVKVGRVGVVLTTRAVSFEAYDPVRAFAYGWVRTWDMATLILKGLYMIVTGGLDRSNIGGPIQIATEAGRQAREGLAAVAFFTAIISVNLAVLNLLPVPMLDGGHLAFFLIEAILGRPLSLAKREKAQQIGLALLLALMAFAVYNDLARLGAFRIFGGG